MKLCFNALDKQHYAMKIMNKRKLKRKFMGRGKNAYHLVENELSILKQIVGPSSNPLTAQDHPNCVNLLEVIDDAEIDKIYLVTEYISGGNLKEKVDKDGLDEAQTRRFFRDIVAGLEYCHEVAGVVHRDVKPENVMIDEGVHGKLVDFGVCHIMKGSNDEMSATAGSTLFYAPEMCTGEPFRGRRTDVWAAGVTLYYMVFRKYPFFTNQMSKAYELIRTAE